MIDVKNVIQSTADKWFLSEPLLFAAFCGHSVTENRRMACAMRSGQRRIEYNPDWLCGLKELEVMELLRREVIRIILKHPYDRQPVNPVPDLLYLASNMTIYAHGGSSIPPGIDISGFGNGKSLSFEEYYNALLHSVPPQNSSNKQDSDETSDGTGDEGSGGSGKDKTDAKSGSDSGGGKGSDGSNDAENNDGDASSGGKSSDGDSESTDGDKSSDNGAAYDGIGDMRPMPKSLQDIKDSGSDATDLWEEDALQIEYINQCIETAMLTRQWGSLAGRVQDLIKASTIKAENIRRRLDMFRTSIISTDRRLTRMRPSRRYGWAQMGVLHPYTSRLLIAVDTSGSIQNSDLVRFFGVINSFFTYGIPFIDVIQFDAEVHMPVLSLKKVTSKIQLRGRGGTCFQAPVDYFTEHKEYDGMIVFTDGYAPLPKAPVNRKILWVLQNIECYNASALSPKVYI